MSNYYKKIILIIILILGVWIMPNNFIKNIIKNANDLIKYNNTVTTGEITKDNGDGTYDVKIANAGSAIPDVETLSYDAIFSEGEIVTIGFENGCKESPKILGHSKKIKQEPKQVEVDYSGGCAGVQTVTETIYRSSFGHIRGTDSDYNKLHDSVDGSDLEEIIIDESMVVGQYHTDYVIFRSFIFFDTSTIPENATITSAIFHFFHYSSEVRTSFNLVIQDGQPYYPCDILIASDYNCENYKNNGGQVNIPIGEVDLGEWLTITLNPNGRNWVNQGGITKFCLRSSADIAGITCADGQQNAVDIPDSNEDEAYKTYITITYTI